MKKVGLVQRRRTEKAIIDALLKISEIVQKTETNRNRQKLLNTHQHSKKTIGDGDYNEFDDEQQKVPVPPSIRKIDSYVSGFNHESSEKPLNSNHLSTYKSKQSSSWHSQETDQRHNRSFEQVHVDYKSSEHTKKRYHDNSSSTSLSSDDNLYRKKSSKQHSSHKSIQSNKNLQPVCQEVEKTENQPTITSFNSPMVSYHANSAATTILDDPSSSLAMVPMNSAPTSSSPMVSEQQQQEQSIDLNRIQIKEEQFSSSSNPLSDFDIFFDQQIQATLEKRMKSQTRLSTKQENIRKKRKNRLVTLTRSETGKLVNQLDLTKQVCNVEHYEKQRKLAMFAAKQGNYSLSYSIYTNLLHDSQYDYKLKSEILASRATTSLLEEKCFESIDDCTQAIAYNEWNKLAYVVRAACWMIKREYSKAVEDYSKLFHFFDQTQQVLDLLNLAYEKLKSFNSDIDDDQSIKNDHTTRQPMASSMDTSVDPTQSLSLVSPTASFMQPAVYLCYPYQAYPTWNSTNNEQQVINRDEIQQPAYTITNTSFTSHPSLIIDQSQISFERTFRNSKEKKHKSCQSIHTNNNAVISAVDRLSTVEQESTSINKNLRSNLLWIKNPRRSF
ncbi:unnamed protein product [Rotaria magnacalcarata]|uniref:Uncharacterized protein n=1 Tax=Rotaria magnacalcarata TaxID=392030 RepID=A0A819GQL9_9BILA|nr:unnamed protein product [Rotaria magnacalcarata]CAF2113158.1 unnamed protein product [Rotaria magnacalcarata]CAF3883598.1 unnamed protein product [Rotaria magnacalcarata]CAF3944653.1 unnamed protein product [Rotaria magnacalcarata]